MRQPKEQALRWLRETEHTLDQAKKIFAGNEGHNLTCFLAEQTCQKALKAIAYSDGARCGGEKDYRRVNNFCAILSNGQVAKRQTHQL